MKHREHIFFSPHLDDAAISCGGHIAALCQAGHAVSVITVFNAALMTSPSAFARHLYADWKLNSTQTSPQLQRLIEDDQALRVLGVQRIVRWDYADAPGRTDAEGHALYACYNELTGCITDADQALIPEIIDRINDTFKTQLLSTLFYFPFSIGGHVDHRILFQVGLTVRAQGCRVCFYEDWPYVDSYVPKPGQVDPPEYRAHWHRYSVLVDVAPKVQAALCYTSQFGVMGGSAQAITQGLSRPHSSQTHIGQVKERFWTLPKRDAKRLISAGPEPTPPFQKALQMPSVRDFRHFLNTFRFNQLDEVLSVGSGLCLDIGCGGGRWKDVTQRFGYHWVGLEYGIQIDSRTVTPPDLQADGQMLPIRSGSAAAAIGWGVMEYMLNPEQAIAEAARVLEPGGVFCGLTAFVQPTQGASLYNMSPRLVSELLRKYGLQDITVGSGLNGFSIMLWTWLRRWGGNRFGRLAIPLALVCLVPPAALRFFVSWLNWRLGRGTGHGMRWIAKDSLNEFAGYVLFTARKPARPKSHQVKTEAEVFLL